MAARRRIRSIVKKLLFSAVMVLLVFGVTEGVLRGMGWPQADPDAQFAHADIYWIEDADQVEVDHPHREVAGSFAVSTDANGLRIPIHPEIKPPNVTRIMTMGCSTTFGWGVGDDESYPARLEARLQEEGYPNVEVINAGQPGYTSFQGRWLWETVAYRYQPDIVLLGFVVQDARKAQYSDLSQALQTGSAEFFKRNLLYKWRLYLLLKSARDRDVIRTKERPDDGDEGVYRVSRQQYLDNLRALRAAIEATGARVVHFGYPLERRGYTKDHRNILRAEAADKGLPHFDPSDQIEEASRQEELYFPRDRGHANAAGNDMIARLMVEFLEVTGLLPPRGN